MVPLQGVNCTSIGVWLAPLARSWLYHVGIYWVPIPFYMVGFVTLVFHSYPTWGSLGDLLRGKPFKGVFLHTQYFGIILLMITSAIVAVTLYLSWLPPWSLVRIECQSECFVYTEDTCRSLACSSPPWCFLQTSGAAILQLCLVVLAVHHVRNLQVPPAWLQRRTRHRVSGDEARLWPCGLTGGMCRGLRPRVFWSRHLDDVAKKLELVSLHVGTVALSIVKSISSLWSKSHEISTARSTWGWQKKRSATCSGDSLVWNWKTSSKIETY